MAINYGKDKNTSNYNLVQVDLQQLRRAHQVSGHQHTAHCRSIGGSQQYNAGHNIWRKRLY